MDCSDVQKHCHPFLDGELSHEQRTEVKLHLEACRCCAHQYKSQEQFHTLVRRTLVQSSASAALRQRVAAAISTSAVVEPEPVPVPVRADAPVHENIFAARAAAKSGRRAAAAAAFLPGSSRLNEFLSLFSKTPFMSCAAVAMLAVSSWLAMGTAGNPPAQVRGRCPLVMAAENAHDNLAVVPTILDFPTDTASLTRYINENLKVLPRFAGIPNLTDCELQAVNCGAICCDGLPKGVFVKFVECKCGDDPVTLMVFDTDKMPSGQENHGFITASSSHHNVVSWKSNKDGLVYVLVTKGPLEHALHVAEIARQ